MIRRNRIGGNALAGWRASVCSPTKPVAMSIVNSNDLTIGYQRFVSDSNQYYLLGYTPDGGAPRRRIPQRDGAREPARRRPCAPDVAITRPPRENRRAADKAPERIPAKNLSRAALETLRMPLSMNGLTLDLFAAPFLAADGKPTVLVGAQIHGEGLVLRPGERLEVGFVGTNAEGKTSPGHFHIIKLNLSDNSRKVVGSIGLPFVDRLRLAAGRHQVRFVVHQPNGKTGTVIADVDVPKFTDAPLSMSGLVLGTNLALPQTAMRRDGEISRLLARRIPDRRSPVFATRAAHRVPEVYTNGKTAHWRDDRDRHARGAASARADSVWPLSSSGPRRTGYRTRFPLSIVRSPATMS